MSESTRRGAAAWRRWRFLAAVLTLVCAAHAASAARGPELRIEADPGVEAAARRLAALDVDLEAFGSLVGLTAPGPPVRVVLVAESSAVARRTPPWVAGFARPEADLVVLFPQRVPTYPYSSFPELVRHELAHVLISRASGGAALPRWFQEGLAMVAEGSWQMADRSRLALAVVGSGAPRLEQLDALFGAGEQWVGRAYATSGAFVRRLLHLHGRDLAARILSLTRSGVEFDEAFGMASGQPPPAAFSAFWARATLWYRWIPFVTSSTVVWIGVTLLALVAIRRRRERDRALLRAWEEEERREEGAAIIEHVD